MTYFQNQMLEYRHNYVPGRMHLHAVLKAKSFMDANYGSRISMALIAREAALSKFHFLRLFKQSMGITAHHYLTSVRVSRAKQLLKQGESVAQVCSQVGFESSTTFSGLFKKMTGLQPSGTSARNHSEARIGFPHWLFPISKSNIEEGQ